MQLLNPLPHSRQGDCSKPSGSPAEEQLAETSGQRQDRCNPSAITQVLARTPVNLLTSDALVLCFVGGQLSCARFSMSGFDQNFGSDALLLFLSRRKTVVRRQTPSPFQFSENGDPAL